MSGEKTEQPTQKRLRDAKKKGQVSKSADVVSTALLLGLFAFIGCDWDQHVQDLANLIIFPAKYLGQPFAVAYPNVLYGLGWEVLRLTLPVLGINIAIAIAANYVQIGAIFTTDTIQPDLKKINPMEKLKQMFSKKNFFEFLKSCFKIIFLGILIYSVIKGLIQDLLMLPFGGISAVMEILGPIMVRFAANVIFAYFVVAIADLFFQKRDFMQKMMMSKDEVKREYKEMEGDPHIKGQRKQLHREMVEQGGAPQKTKNASALVTNPDHIAIALYYEIENKGVQLPIVLAKGKDLVATLMIEEARKNKIPIMRNVPLAHSLYDMAEVMKYIPTELIDPVATVLRWVYDIREKQKEERLWQYTHGTGETELEADSSFQD